MILALDAATRSCSAALWRGGAVRARRFVETERGQAEMLAPMVETVLNESGAAPNDLDLIATTVGPGAFTGIRIGLAMARGLALATGAPCMGVTSMAAVARAVPSSRLRGRALIVALDAKRSDIYAQAFGPDGAALGPPRALLPEAAGALLPPGPTLVAGDACEAAARHLDGAEALPILPDAVHVAEIAAERWERGERDGAFPEPLYLRPPDAALPKNGGRLRP